MLVLSRRAGDSLVIDGKIEIKVIEISGDKVRIGVDAPKEMVVLRKELSLTVENNRAAATSTSPKDLIDFISRIK